MMQVNRAEFERIAAVMPEDKVGDVTAMMYVTCRLLAARGLLEFRGMSTHHGQPSYYVYSNPNTGEIYAVQHPSIGIDAERLLSDRLVSLACRPPN